jgi:hypothetical protein
MRRASVGLCVAIALVAFVSTAGAVDQRNTGCGLGSMIFEGQNGLVQQVVAVTTNNTFWNQTFGISFGTSNCERYKTFTMNEQVNTFVAHNMDGVAKDIAKGEGEYLDTMTGLMQMDPVQRPQFYTLLQKNFSRIYTSPAVTPAEVLANINGVASSM